MDSLSATLIDQRALPLEQLEGQLLSDLSKSPNKPVLWTARRPRKRWFVGLVAHRPLVLASSSQFEQILWLPPDALAPVPEEWQTESESLLEDYPRLFESGDAQSYSERVRSHIAKQESELFDELKSRLPSTERALRELCYEHRGLEAGLERLPTILSRFRSGDLSSRDRERFDLDFYHLLEHNLERKLEAVFPALAYFRRQKIDNKG